jgi:hypothetical protein
MILAFTEVHCLPHDRYHTILRVSNKHRLPYSNPLTGLDSSYHDWLHFCGMAQKPGDGDGRVANFIFLSDFIDLLIQFRELVASEENALLKINLRNIRTKGKLVLSGLNR